MDRYGFHHQFPRRVEQELKGLDAERILRSHQGDRADLRSLLWSSIDNADSLDLDQLDYCERGPRQEVLVKVAIADVEDPGAGTVPQQAGNLRFARPRLAVEQDVHALLASRDAPGEIVPDQRHVLFDVREVVPGKGWRRTLP